MEFRPGGGTEIPSGMPGSTIISDKIIQKTSYKGVLGYIRHHDAAARIQYAPHFREHCALVLDVMETCYRQDTVDAAILQRKPVVFVKNNVLAPCYSQFRESL